MNRVTTQSTQMKKKRKGPFAFPWWCLIIAYILAYLFIAISIFFIIVRGVEFGDEKTQKWLTSILTGLFSSVIVTEPIKVILPPFNCHRLLYLSSAV